MRNIIVILIVFTSFGVFAQGKSDIIARGIEVRKYYETDVENAGDEFLFKEEHYNFQGEIVEWKEYDESGKVTLWIKYKYDQQANVIEELELDSKGRQDKRIVHEYENGLRVAKKYFDSKDRLYRTRRYEYGYRK
jgi:hypothetical protein